MEIIVIDDEFSAINTFLYAIIDIYDLKYKMFNHNILESINYIKQNNVKCAFIDINMPEINGIDLAKKMITIKPDLDIVLITGYTYEEEKIKKTLGDNLIGYCHKPYSKEMIGEYIQKIYMKNNQAEVVIKTFGPFDVFINNQPIHFLSSKSKELLAILVDYKGSRVSMGLAISLLWPDKNIEFSKKLYRDAVWRLRKSLIENNLQDLVTFERAELYINKENIKCDYWDFLDGKMDNFYGEYNVNYDWSCKTERILENMSIKKPKW